MVALAYQVQGGHIAQLIHKLWIHELSWVASIPSTYSSRCAQGLNVEGPTEILFEGDIQ